MSTITTIFNRKRITQIITYLLIVGSIVYAGTYTYNVSILGNGLHINGRSEVVIECISAICIDNKSIKECVELGEPILFRVSHDPNLSYYEDGIFDVNFSAVKKCHGGIK